MMLMKSAVFWGIGPILTGPETREDGTDTLSRNVGKQLPHGAA